MDRNSNQPDSSQGASPQSASRSEADSAEPRPEEPRSEKLRLTAYRTSPIALPIEAAKPQRQWMDETRFGFANRCLPLRIANQAGWMLLNDRKIDAIWNGGLFLEDVKVTHHKLSPTDDLSTRPQFVLSHFGSGIVTWRIPYLFRTPPGYDLYVRGPANTFKDGASPLDGIVETDWSVATFTMNWKLTRPNLPVSWEAGEPICMVFPIPRGDLERFHPEVKNLTDEPELFEKVKQWTEERASFTEKLKTEAKSPVWQADYYVGRSSAGGSSPDHQLKLNLREFEEH